MGFIKGSVVFVFTIALFFSLFIGNIFLTLNWSLEYENVEPHLENITTEIFKTTELNTLLTDQYETMQTICLTYDSFDFLYKEEVIEIPCEKIFLGPEAMIKGQAGKIIEERYYQEHECDLMDCIKEDPLILVSEKSKNYWKSKFFTALIISIILFAALFILAKDKHMPILISGVLLVVTALPFKKINILTDLFADLLPFDILRIFFSKAESVFLTMAIIGVIFVIFGFAVGFFKWGNKMNDFLNKIIKRKKEETKEENEVTKDEVKSIVKKEIKKSKNQP